ncbi:hypothetical protein EA58_00570 [Photobacterium galatheae]|uniref:Bacterial sugar transferase domain-containing protein n=1 Tax=Photobacterium galatheae TaxID=1654360 RepID=A0A066RWA4_9GAMM|nr:hypothetical protein EA58_00570 [Photobacterium galatheae]
MSFLTLSAIVFIIYHHLGYPLLLRWLSKNASSVKPQVIKPQAVSREYQDSASDADLPSIAILVPAYNEAAWIAEKIRNLAALDYPGNKLSIVIACDGCQDETAALARQAADELACRHLNMTVMEFAENRGKVATINEVIPLLECDLVALSDVSAIISCDALLQAAACFADPTVGVLNSHYQIYQPGTDGEATYWRYQGRLKAQEAALGATLGAHGAFYLFRHALFEPLPTDTINDDFVLPMRIVAQGYRAAHEDQIIALELEASSAAMDFRRRQRIGAGNLQQVVRLKQLLSPRYRGVAFLFTSGKVLRVLSGYLMVFALAGSLLLAGESSVFLCLAILQSVLYLIAIITLIFPAVPTGKPGHTLAYLVSGHAASLIGSLKYALGLEKARWQRVTALSTSDRRPFVIYANQHRSSTMSPITAKTKRTMDIVIAGLGLALTLPVFPIIALATKLDSPGPVFFQQRRIGQMLPEQTRIFDILKFRTMVANAESVTGAILASKADPRITRVGAFLRKTRLDELPQLINVLRGDMSIVGPRPERPEFYQQLESAIPFFTERTYGILPGITGLAQINQGYDTSIEDVRSKVAFDHSYALVLGSFWPWFRTDLMIMFKTFGIMLGRKGQ